MPTHLRSLPGKVTIVNGRPGKEFTAINGLSGCVHRSVESYPLYGYAVTGHELTSSYRVTFSYDGVTSVAVITPRLCSRSTPALFTTYDLEDLEIEVEPIAS